MFVLAVIVVSGVNAFALQSSLDIPSNGVINYPTGMLKLHVDGVVIKDVAGRKVRLAGFSGHPWHDRDDRFTLTESDIQWISSQSFNVLRAVLFWHQWEPIEGQIEESYFTNYLDKMIDWCEQYRIYVILDMHQAGWSPHFGGYGFPDWSCDTYATTDDFALAFWRNEGQAASTRQKYIENWQYIANRYKNRGGVIAGYELFSEPYVYDSKHETQDEIAPKIMEFFDKELAPAIREVDPDTIIFYDAFVTWRPYGYTEDYNEKPTLSNVAWARSLYDLVSSYHEYGRESQYPSLETGIQRQYQKYVIEFGCPFFISEMGWARDNITYQWVTDVLNLWEEQVGGEPYSLNFAWWRYSKVSDDDFRIRETDGTPRPELSILKEHILPTFS